MMHLRDQSRFDRALAFREAQGPDTAVSPSGVVAMRQEQRLLLIAIQQLPHDLQIALQLFYWERMKNREIAEVLEIPMGTVGNRIARARELVRDSLAQMRVSEAMQKSVNEDFERWTRSLLAEATAPSPRGRK
jgi:RNA polymerase sigma-70 factor (ECF subfamily)